MLFSAGYRGDLRLSPRSDAIDTGLQAHYSWLPTGCEIEVSFSDYNSFFPKKIRIIFE
jgi:hypothetical protein